MVPVFAVGSGLFASARVASRRLKTAQNLAQMLGNRGGPERIRTFDLCLRRVARGAALGVIYQHLAGPCKRPVPKWCLKLAKRRIVDRDLRAAVVAITIDDDRLALAVDQRQ
jgi:hypothetical protein